MGLSMRAYARHRGVSESLVRKAVASGRITPGQDGTIDPEIADQEWGRNSSAPRFGSSKGAVKVAVPDAGAGGNDGPAALPAGGTSLLQARTVNEVVKAQTNKVRLARLKGELVDRNRAVALVFQLGREERDAWLNWPARISAQLAARLGLDAHTMHVALENAVREHLRELGEMRVRVD